MGSNKFHFCVFERAENGDIVIVEELKGTPALGENMCDAPPFFKKQNLRNAVRLLQAAVMMFRRHHVAPDDNYTVGTAALRDAAQALERLKDEKGPKLKQGRAAMQILRRAYGEYTFVIASEEQEAAFVTAAAARELFQNPSAAVAALVAAHPHITLAHFGGRTTEIIDVVGGDALRHVVLPHGVHTHRFAVRDHAGHLPVTAEAFAVDLQQAWPGGQQPLLAVSGGAWRANGKLICGKGIPLLAAQQARDRLQMQAACDEGYFVKKGEKKRAPHMANTARALALLVDHVDASAVLFLQERMFMAVARELLDRRWSVAASLRLRPATSPPACPLSPAPVCRV